MQRLFRFIAQSIGLAPDPRARRHSAERPIRLLVTATSWCRCCCSWVWRWISYQQHREDAIDRVQRNLGIVHEHARKVFETFELTERYLEQILGDATDEQIRSAEAAYSRRLRVMVERAAAAARHLDRGRQGHPAGVGHRVPDAEDRPVGSRIFHRPPRCAERWRLRQRTAERTRGRSRSSSRSAGGAPSAASSAASSCISVSPGLFREFLQDAPAAGHRRAAARRRRRSGAASRRPRPEPPPAGNVAVPAGDPAQSAVGHRGRRLVARRQRPHLRLPAGSRRCRSTSPPAPASARSFAPGCSNMASTWCSACPPCWRWSASA